MEDLGARIKKSRIQAGFRTQEQLAAKMNVIRQTVSHWENGTRKPDTESLAKLAELFGVTTDYLLGQKSNPLTQEHLTNTYSEITKNLGEDVQVMFHDITTFDEEELDKLKFAIEMIKRDKKKKTP